MDDQVEKVLMPKLRVHDIVKVGRKIGVVVYTNGPAYQTGSTIVRFRRETDGQLGSRRTFRWGEPGSKPRVVMRLGSAALNTVLTWHDGIDTVVDPGEMT